LLSISIVTGPSFNKLTFISAQKYQFVLFSHYQFNGLYKIFIKWNRNIWFCCFDIRRTIAFFVLAWSVNWLTTIISPSISWTDKFITWFSSSKYGFWWFSLLASQCLLDYPYLLFQLKLLVLLNVGYYFMFNGYGWRNSLRTISFYYIK
jgi:hypothetical protein